jgi:hypothetical protein
MSFLNLTKFSLIAPVAARSQQQQRDFQSRAGYQPAPRRRITQTDPPTEGRMDIKYPVRVQSAAPTRHLRSEYVRSGSF